MLGKLVPESVHEYVHEHPKVLIWMGVALVGFSMYNLYDAVSFLVRAQAAVREIASNAAREASESLGG